MNIARKLYFLLLAPLFLSGTALPISDAERDQKIDIALCHFYNGKTQAAKEIVGGLKETFPRDPFFNELMAEIIWQELEKKAASGFQKYKKVDAEAVRKNRYLVEQFYREIFEGLVLTQLETGRDSGPKRLFLRGMLLVRLGGFIAKFESGLRSYSEADQKTAEGILLLQESMRIDPSLRSAKYVFALGKYSVIKGANENLLNRVAIILRSRIYRVLGSNFNLNDAFSWLREAINCDSPHYYAKDINIDKKFVFQDILMSQAGRMDNEALPVLEELHSRFPENTVIRDNLFLARFHLKNKK